MRRKVELATHKPEWAARYQEEAKRLTAVFHPILRAIHHIHVFQTGHPEIARHLNFCDYLIAYPEVAQAYSRLKEDLARQFPTDTRRYSESKSGFIWDVEEKAAAWQAERRNKG